MEEIMVSICCLAYNHEKYIRKCLDGFLMQKCNFKYEILIHDDASTDNTANIIREYEANYPDLIKPIYQTENKFSKGEKVSKYNILRAKGKYIAFCEGDDYWVHPDKLQLQVNALINHPNCKFCTHCVQAVSDDEVNLNYNYPKKYVLENDILLTSRTFLTIECSEKYAFQTSSYLFSASELIDFYRNPPSFFKVATVGDLPMMLYASKIGDVYYINRIMSCYRRGSTASIERGKEFSVSEEKLKKHNLPQKKCLDEFDKYTDYKYHKLCKRKKNALDFYGAWNFSNYREMIKPKYRFFMREFPLKARVKIYLTAIFPKLISKYDARNSQI